MSRYSWHERGGVSSRQGTGRLPILLPETWTAIPEAGWATGNQTWTDYPAGMPGLDEHQDSLSLPVQRAGE
jgi:hypothetical protein